MGRVRGSDGRLKTGRVDSGENRGIKGEGTRREGGRGIRREKGNKAGEEGREEKREEKREKGKERRERKYLDQYL